MSDCQFNNTRNSVKFFSIISTYNPCFCMNREREWSTDVKIQMNRAGARESYLRVCIALESDCLDADLG